MLKDFTRQRNELANNFNSQNKKLIEKKAKLFAEKKYEKWDVPKNINIEDI